MLGYKAFYRNTIYMQPKVATNPIAFLLVAIIVVE